MTIIDLLNARDAVGALYQAKVDGATALKIRRAVRQMNDPIQDYDDTLKAWVQENEIDGKQVADLTPEQQRHWSQMVSVEVEQTWESLIGPDVLESIELSAFQLNALIEVGLVQDV